MSVVSSYDLARRQELLEVMTRDLLAEGVPQEAWPRRLPNNYNAYTVKSVGGARIQVLLAVREFLVPRPVPHWGNGRSFRIGWDDFADVEKAWAVAKQVAGW